jgi:hypothetical protein
MPRKRRVPARRKPTGEEPNAFVGAWQITRDHPYAVAVLFGCVGFGQVVFDSRRPAEQWPGTAVGVLATLTLVVALQRDRLPSTHGKGEKAAATVVAAWVVFAFGISSGQARVNEKFYWWQDGTVIGALSALMVVLVVVAILPVQSRED